MKVENKIIIVTGGGSGVGRELVLKLLSKGARVIGLDINKSGLDETSKIAALKAEFLTTYVVDISDKSAVEALAKIIIAENIFVDGLINNAGIIQPFSKVNELDYEVINRVFNVNFFGTLFLTKTFLPHLITRPEAHIVNISSMGGFLPVPGQTIYCSAKAAVKMFTEGLNAELTDTNVRVSVVFPGAVNTKIMSNSGLSETEASADEKQKIKILSAEQAAKLIIDGVEANEPRIIVGKDSKIMNILYRLNPGLASKLIYKKMRDKLLTQPRIYVGD